MSLRILRQKFRTLFLGVFLIGAALGGMPIQPEEIEEQLRSASKSEAVQMLESKGESAGDAPSPGASGMERVDPLCEQ